MRFRDRCISAMTLLVWFSVTPAESASNRYADRFVNTVTATSVSAEFTESLIYGNAEYGYFETTEISRQGQRVAARLVPPGFRIPIDIYLKKKRADATFYYEKVGSQTFAFPLSPNEIVPQPLPKADNFTPRFFLGRGIDKGAKSVVFIANRFAEIVWVYATPGPIMNYAALPLGKGRYASLGDFGLFEIFHFDGTVERTIDLATNTHHDFLYDGGNHITGLGLELVNLTGQSGSSLKPGQYWVGKILDLDLTSKKVVTLWNALADSILLSGRQLLKVTPRAVGGLDHINSIDHGAGKGYLASLRNLNTLLFFDESFRLIWSLGNAPGVTISTKGTNFEFRGQHHATLLENGNIQLLDNNGKQKTRILELKVDEISQSASLVREFLPDLPLHGAQRGSAFRIANGNTVALINATLSPNPAQHVVEFDSMGRQTALMTIPNEVLGDGYRMSPLDTIGNEVYLGPSL